MSTTAWPQPLLISGHRPWQRPGPDTHTDSPPQPTPRSWLYPKPSGSSVPYRFTEISLILIRHTAYLTLLFVVLPVGMAFAFFGVQVGFFGVLLGGAFALNHIGMPTVPADVRLDFLRRQVVMSRNIQDGPLMRFLMGGLQYQIEHHLFPVAPRPSLPALQKRVREYCARHDIPYTERTVTEAAKTVVAYLNQVGLKNRDPYVCPLVQRFRG